MAGFPPGAFEPALTAANEAAPDGGLRAAPIGDYRAIFAAFSQINAPAAAAAEPRSCVKDVTR